jgi:hypothetical protein
MEMTEKFVYYRMWKGGGYFAIASFLILGGIGLTIVSFIGFLDPRGYSDMLAGGILFLVFSFILYGLAYYCIKTGFKEVNLDGQGRWVTIPEYQTQSSSYYRSEEPSRDDDSDECSISIGRDLSPGEQYIAYQNYHRRMGR